MRQNSDENSDLDEPSRDLALKQKIYNEKRQLGKKAGDRFRTFDHEALGQVKHILKESREETGE
jgi:hypothetical protein